ncbi:hypothetical protein N7522_006231 [Penicillium canescens]|nr:hypothetical protein N7522_006231 [Penicillium canescens]
MTPLEELDFEVKKFFDKGPLDASIKFHALQGAVLEGTTVVDIYGAQDLPPIFVQAIPWNSCKLATTLVLLFACPSESECILNALKYQSRSLGGLPTMADIVNTPSADLPERFARAKKAAIDGKFGETTVFGVSLVDVEMIERGETGSSDMRYSSFAHSFVLAVGREGVRVFQAWGEHGYRLDQYLMRGGSRLRNWQDAKKFLKTFSKLACSQVHITVSLPSILMIVTLQQGEWSQSLNMAYEDCFEVNMISICGKGKKQAPIVPKYRPWVRIYEINNVRLENLKKWTWNGPSVK